MQISKGLESNVKQNAYFSSEESANTDISFNSSYDDETAKDEEEDYSDKVTQLQE